MKRYKRIKQVNSRLRNRFKVVERIKKKLDRFNTDLEGLLDFPYYVGFSTVHRKYYLNNVNTGKALALENVARHFKENNSMSNRQFEYIRTNGN